MKSRFREFLAWWIAAAIVILIIAITAKVVLGGELNTYKVSGENLHTGLRVAGQAWEQDKEGNIKAKVYDKMQIFDQCWGAWVAYGVMQVGCENGEQYMLEVVE
ncbi:MAG: hypothetical protein RBR45_15550 [Pseudomonas sp.]|nr:hypothetical protein [Pseudomonas sp.]